MIRNIDNDSRLADEMEFEEEKMWLERHRIIAGLISPLIYLFMLSIYLLNKKEVIELMIEQSFGYVIAIFLVVTVGLCCFIENILLQVGREISFFSNTILLLSFKILYGLIFFLLVGVGFGTIVIRCINASKVGPQYIICSEVEINRNAKGNPYYYRIPSGIGDKYMYEKLRGYESVKCRVGDALAVICCKGRLNIPIIEDVKLVEDFTPEELRCLRMQKDRDLTQADIEEARRHKAEKAAEAEVIAEHNEELEEENAFAEYIKERLPVIGESHSGWLLASFRIEKDGSISNIKTLERLHPTADKALLNLLNGMYRWRGRHQIGVVEKATIKLAYHYGKPQYMFINRESVSDKGEKQTIEDGYTLSDENGNAVRTVHEESNR